ncbi:hypothetical protein [Dokdonella sp.]|uniref:hypothetical protein n=1 Tax=Dokdonella sp. TaxID=2291710 RepID=UPI00378405E8
MNVLPALMIWLVPLLFGSGLWVAVVGWPRRAHGLATILGGGWIVGVLLCGLLMQHVAAELSSSALRAGSIAGLIGIGGWIVARLWRRAGDVAPPVHPVGWKGRALIALVLVVLAWRAWLFATDIALHPTLPWDAWAVWQAKAKAWVLAGHAAPYVPFSRWLSEPQADLRTAAAWSYPELLSWTMTWFAANAGWIEPWINLAWLGLWAGLLAAHYGQWRALGVRTVHAAAGVYLLGSLPLLDAHVALGGYVDLWLAALMSLAGHAWLRWRDSRDARQLLIVVGVIALLPMLKLEGAVWSIVFGASCVFGVLPRRMRGRRFLIGAGVAIVAIALCVALRVPWVEVARNYAHGSLVFDAAQVGKSSRALANALWGQWNWNLLWFALPVVLVCKRDWLHTATTRRLLALVAVPLLLIGGLFAFTTAARYAQSYSAVNRLLLQLTPLLVSLLVLALWLPRDVAADQGVGAEPGDSRPE